MTIDVGRNDAAGAYELRLDGTVVGRAFFQVRPGHLIFTHTEVDDAVAGRGMGGRLAQDALDDVRARGLSVVPRCPFIAAWIEKHPDYADLVLAAAGPTSAPAHAEDGREVIGGEPQLG